jgi:hypothetical protein
VPLKDVMKTLPFINKTKNPTKWRNKKLQDGRTQVLTNEESSKKDGLC